MSAVAVRAALGVKGLTVGTKFVLVVLAEHAHSTTHLAWPSAALVAEETGLQRQTVAAAMKALRDRGLIVEAGRVRQVVRYLVDPARLVALADVSADVQDVSADVRHLSPVPTAPVVSADTEQEGTSRNPQGNLQTIATAIVREWWEALDVKPAGRGAWHSAVNTVTAVLKAGHQPEAVKGALKQMTPPLSIARLEIELGKRRGRRSTVIETNQAHWQQGGQF